MERFQKRLVEDGAVFSGDDGRQHVLHFGDFRKEYGSLTTGVGVVEMASRSQVELGGEDAAAFLHNFCTNDINALAAGQGCEAFLTSRQGKTIGHFYVFRHGESLVVDTVAGEGETILAHLDRYLIREKVELRNRGEDWADLLVGGAKSGELLSRLIGNAPPASRLEHCDARLAGLEVSLRRVDWMEADAFLLSTARECVADVWSALRDAGAAACGGQAFDAARIEAGLPVFGRDITEDNLPQEVDRNALAISFTKGCYLGQETVARLDALGKVNRLLRAVCFAGDEVPSAGAELLDGDKVVGKVTSAAFSPKAGAPLALAYVRRGHHEPGAVLDSRFGEATVVALPFSKNDG